MMDLHLPDSVNPESDHLDVTGPDTDGDMTFIAWEGNRSAVVFLNKANQQALRDWLIRYNGDAE